MKNRIKKLVVSAVLSATLVFGAVSTASAFQYDRGDFVIGIMGTTTELAIEIGATGYVDHNTMYDIPTTSVIDLFNINDVNAVFPGDTLATLSLVGFMGSAGSDGFYRGYFAVQDGWTNTGNPDTMNTRHNALSSFDAATNDMGMLHSNGVQGGYVSGPVGDLSIKWGMADGIYNGFLDDNQPGHGEYGTQYGGPNPADNNGLERLGVLEDGVYGDYTMNIWMEGDDNYGYGQGWDYVWDISPPTKLNYNVHVGVDENGMVYAEVVNAVPIPGAIWLLASGILGMMGMRRKSNG